MESRIILVRHGRSAHATHAGWLDVSGVQHWRGGYDAAGLADDTTPSAALTEEAARADVLIASDMPRAVDSASRLAGGREVVLSPLLRETALDIPTWLPMRWPLGVWGAAIHAQWWYRRLLGTDAPPEEAARAAAAATFLGGYARRGSTVLVVTHGVFRRLLTIRLLADGWHADPGWRSYRHWSAWSLRNGARG